MQTVNYINYTCLRTEFPLPAHLDTPPPRPSENHWVADCPLLINFLQACIYTITHFLNLKKITKTKRFPHHCIHIKDRYVIPLGNYNTKVNLFRTKLRFHQKESVYVFWRSKRLFWCYHTGVYLMSLQDVYFR